MAIEWRPRENYPDEPVVQYFALCADRDAPSARLVAVTKRTDGLSLQLHGGGCIHVCIYDITPAVMPVPSSPIEYAFTHKSDACYCYTRPLSDEQVNELVEYFLVADLDEHDRMIGARSCN